MQTVKGVVVDPSKNSITVPNTKCAQKFSLHITTSNKNVLITTFKIVEQVGRKATKLAITDLEMWRGSEFKAGKHLLHTTTCEVGSNANSIPALTPFILTQEQAKMLNALNACKKVKRELTNAKLKNGEAVTKLSDEINQLKKQLIQPAVSQPVMTPATNAPRVAAVASQPATSSTPPANTTASTSARSVVSTAVQPANGTQPQPVTPPANQPAGGARPATSLTAPANTAPAVVPTTAHAQPTGGPATQPQPATPPAANAPRVAPVATQTATPPANQPAGGGSRAATPTTGTQGTAPATAPGAQPVATGWWDRVTAHRNNIIIAIALVCLLLLAVWLYNGMSWPHGSSLVTDSTMSSQDQPADSGLTKASQSSQSGGNTAEGLTVICNSNSMVNSEINVSFSQEVHNLNIQPPSVQIHEIIVGGSNPETVIEEDSSPLPDQTTYEQPQVQVVRPYVSTVGYPKFGYQQYQPAIVWCAPIQRPTARYCPPPHILPAIRGKGR